MTAKSQSKDLTLEAPSKPWMIFIVLLVAVVISSIAVVSSTHRSRHLLNDLKQLESERNSLQVLWGQLLLEQSSLVSQGRVENVARAELNMVIPRTENIVVVNRD